MSFRSTFHQTPLVSFQVPLLNFGLVAVGERATKGLSLTNNNQAPVTFSMHCIPQTVDQENKKLSVSRM